jgi:hypothetical protein
MTATAFEPGGAVEAVFGFDLRAGLSFEIRGKGKARVNDLFLNLVPPHPGIADVSITGDLLRTARVFDFVIPHPKVISCDAILFILFSLHPMIPQPCFRHLGVWPNVRRLVSKHEMPVGFDLECREGGGRIQNGNAAEIGLQEDSCSKHVLIQGAGWSRDETWIIVRFVTLPRSPELLTRVVK